MADYGFVMTVQDLTSSQMKKIENSVKGLSSTVKTETSNIQSSFAGVSQSARELTGYIAGAFAVHSIIDFGKELLHTAAEFQGFGNVIKYSSMGTVDAAQNMDYLQDAVIRLKLPMRETYESFSEMEAGFYGTGIQGEKLRKVFEGVAEASSVLHLNPATFSRVTFALKEIGELGTLQARQLRMLSFSLPGAGNLAAQSMGMTSRGLHEAMKKGLVNASDFLPKFAETLTKHFEKGLKNAGDSLISQMNVMSNSILNLKLDMGEKLAPFFTHVMDSITSGMQQIKSIWDSLTSNSDFTDTLKFIYDWTVKLVPIWAGYRLIMAGWNGIIALSTILESLFTRELISNTAATVANYGAMGIARVEVGGFGAMMATAAAEVDVATGSFVALEAALGTFAVAGIVIGLGLLIEKLISMNKESKDIADNLTNITKIQGIGKQSDDMATDLTNRFKDYGHAGTADDKAILLKDLIQSQKFLQDQYTKDVHPALSNTAKLVESANKILGYTEKQVGTGSGGVPMFLTVPVYAEPDAVKRNRLNEDQGNTKKVAGGLLTSLRSVGLMIQNLQDNQKIKPAKPGEFGEGDDTLKNGAINTSNLAGAAGGLGQAKTINMHIGIVQQNNGVKESRDHAEESVQKIIEMLNGFDQSQNAQ